MDLHRGYLWEYTVQHVVMSTIVYTLPPVSGSILQEDGADSV